MQTALDWHKTKQQQQKNTRIWIYVNINNIWISKFIIDNDIIFIQLTCLGDILPYPIPIWN